MKARKNPVLVSKTETRWQNFSLSSRSLRLGGKILMLVSKHEIERKKFSISSRSTRLKERKSRSRLEAWDWKKEILDPVSDTRLKDRYSRSRLESWNRALVGHCCILIRCIPIRCIFINEDATRMQWGSWCRGSRSGGPNSSTWAKIWNSGQLAKRKLCDFFVKICLNLNF